MSQGSFSPKIRFLAQQVCSVARRQTDRKVKMAPKNPIFQNFEKQKNAFLSHVPRTLQSKNQVRRPKGVLCSSETDRQESENGPKNPIFQNFEKQKFQFLSHVPRILQSKNQVSRPKGVLCRSHANRQTDTKVNTEDTLSGYQDFSNFPSTYHQGAVQ